MVFISVFKNHLDGIKDKIQSQSESLSVGVRDCPSKFALQYQTLWDIKKMIEASDSLLLQKKSEIGWATEKAIEDEGMKVQLIG